DLHLEVVGAHVLPRPAQPLLAATPGKARAGAVASSAGSLGPAASVPAGRCGLSPLPDGAAGSWRVLGGDGQSLPVPVPSARVATVPESVVNSLRELTTLRFAVNGSGEGGVSTNSRSGVGTNCLAQPSRRRIVPEID